MNLTINGNKLKVTPALRAYAQEKLGRVMRRSDQITSIDLRFRVEPQRAPDTPHQAQITVKVGKKPPLHAQYACLDLYAAIDGVLDKACRLVGNTNNRSKRHKAEPTGRMFGAGGHQYA